MTFETIITDFNKLLNICKKYDITDPSKTLKIIKKIVKPYNNLELPYSLYKNINEIYVITKSLLKEDLMYVAPEILQEYFRQLENCINLVLFYEF
jgi:hypothetical protein